MSRYTFFITVHALPANAIAGTGIEREGRSYATLCVSPAALATTTFDISFEDAATRLTRLPRMYCEPDGSFVWVSPQGAAIWQIDGNLYDRDGRLLFVDLKGSCPPAEFDELLRAFGWPATPLVFQLTREAVFLAEAEFRRWAETAAANGP